MLEIVIIVNDYRDFGNAAGTEGAKILVWGAVGDKLKKIDPKRMLALIQQDPNYFLSVIGNIETDELIAKILEWANTKKEWPKEIDDLVYQINKLDSLFLETSKFLHESQDILATGSFVTGEFEQKKAILKTMGKVEKNEGDG